MNFNQLDTMLMVAEMGSFLRAAHQIGVTSQSVMQQVDAIERELGFAVFNRSNRGVALTDAGELFCAEERAVLQGHQRAVERSRRLARQPRTLRVGFPSGVAPTFLLSVCAAFAEDHPEAHIDHVAYRPAEIYDALSDGKIDVCMATEPQEMAGHHPSESAELFDVLLYCITARAHPFCLSAFVGEPQLRGVPLGVWEAPGKYRGLLRRLGTPEVTDLRRDIGASLSLCMNGGIILASMPVVQLLKDNLLATPVDFDCGMRYLVRYMNAANPLVADFVRIAQQLGSSKDNPWYRQHRELMDGRE